MSGVEKEAPAVETVIRYSTLNLLGYLLFCAGLEAVAVHTLLTVRPLGVGAPFGFLIALGCPVIIGRQLWLLFHNRPQLTLSAQGIRVASGVLDAWEDIEDEAVQKVRRGRGTDTILFYRVGSEERRLNLRELAISPAQLTLLLVHYRDYSPD